MIRKKSCITPIAACRDAISLLWIAMLFWGLAARVPAAETTSPDVFGLAVVHQFHIEMSAEEYKAMQPPTDGFRRPNGRTLARNRVVTPPAKDSHRDGFNEFPWVRTTFAANGHVYKNAAVRYKGHF